MWIVFSFPLIKKNFTIDIKDSQLLVTLCNVSNNIVEEYYRYLYKKEISVIGGSFFRKKKVSLYHLYLVIKEAITKHGTSIIFYYNFIYDKEYPQITIYRDISLCPKNILFWLEKLSLIIKIKEKNEKERDLYAYKIGDFLKMIAKKNRVIFIFAEGNIRAENGFRKIIDFLSMMDVTSIL